MLKETSRDMDDRVRRPNIHIKVMQKKVDGCRYWWGGAKSEEIMAENFPKMDEKHGSLDP